MDVLSLFRDVFANSLDGIVITDPDTNILDANPAFEAVTGYSRPELIGQQTRLMKSGLTASQTFVDMWDALTTRGRWVGEVVNRKKSGELWHSFLSITRVLDERGEVSAYVGIARDITSRKQMEHQLRQNLLELEAAHQRSHATATRLRSLLESVSEAILMVDNEGRCVVANHQIGGVLGRTAEEISGRPIHELRVLIARAFRTTGALEWDMDPGGLPSVELTTVTLETSEEKPRVFHEFSSPVQDESGAVIGRIFVYRDITKETEVDRMKSDFIATVSHELRTPMTSIKGSLGLVLGGATGSLSPDARDLMTIAQNNTDRLIRLINDILDISRIEAGKMEIKRAPLVVSEVVWRAVREMEGFAAQRSIPVISAVPDNLPRVVADSDRLEQVLVNLLSNAIKFSAAGAVVTVTAGLGAGEVWIRVEDHGPGIAPEQQPFIFDKFHRVDNAASRKTGGTGLGLAICKAIVEEQGGNIWVESTPGVGSAFTFTTPVEPAPRVMELKVESGQTVLVVDDDPDIVRLIALSLEQEGFLSLGATSGPEALEIARTHKVDCITLDLAMPEIHGLEVARRLKEDPVTASIPVVVVSAYSQGVEPQLVSLGISGVVSKPIDEGRLLAAIRGVLGSRPAGSRGVPSILVVDDDDDVRRIVRALLERAGYAVRTAADGQEAMNLIQEERPDLLILDLLMPNVDGFQLVRLLRQRRFTQSIPLLVLTALDLTEGERTLLQLGPTRHLTKGPAIKEEVVARVRELLKA